MKYEFGTLKCFLLQVVYDQSQVNLPRGSYSDRKVSERSY